MSDRPLRQIRRALEEMEIAPRRLILTVCLELASGVLKVAALALCLPLFQQLLAKQPNSGTVWRTLERYVPGVASANHWQVITLLVSLTFTAACIGSLCGYFAARLTADAAAAAEVVLGEKLLRRHLRFAQSYFDQTKLGVTLSHLQGLPRKAVRLVPWSQHATEALLSLALLAALMVKLSPTLAAVSLAALGVYYFLVKRLIDRAERQTQEEEEFEEAALVDIQDLVSNLALARIFTSERRAVDDFKRRATVRAAAGSRSRSQIELVDQAREVLNTTVVLAFALASAWALRGLEPAELSRYLVFFFVFRRAMAPFSELQRLPRRWRFLDEQLTTLHDLLSGPAQPVLVIGTRPFAGLERGVTVRNLTFAYGENPPVLSEVSCEALRGRYTTLVGRTGSGKSTLLRLWLRLYDPPPGTILMDGVDLRDLDVEQLRARIAFADAHPQLFNASLRSNLAYGLEDVTEDRLHEAVELAGLTTVIGRLRDGFDEVLGDRGTRLSTGERQRLGIARALLRDADLVLWDEATSALDVFAERQALQAAERLALRKTVVTVTHRLSTIPACAWVVVLDRGRVVEQGFRDDLLAGAGELSLLMAKSATEPETAWPRLAAGE